MRKLVVFAIAWGLASFSNAVTLNLDPGVEMFTSSPELNDGFNFGRGMVFTMASDVSISGVGFFTDMPSGTATYNIRRITHTSGLVNSGSTLVSTVTGTIGGSGPQYYDLALPSLLKLDGGVSYHVEVTYTEAATQNYYYDWNGPAVDLTWLNLIDGTQSGHTANTVAPVLHLVIPAPVPEPVSILGFGLGIFGLARRRRRG